MGPKSLPKIFSFRSFHSVFVCHSQTFTMFGIFCWQSIENTTSGNSETSLRLLCSDQQSFTVEHARIIVHRAARSHPHSVSHSAFRSWHNSLRVATVANKQTNFRSFTMVWFLFPLLLFFFSTFGNIWLLYVSSMTCLAPDHAPGPMRRYWAAQQGPVKHLRASRGSLKNSLPRFGLQPIKSAI